jgi:glycine/serine hydroxymethyltransferase
MKEAEMAQIGGWIGEVLAEPENPVTRAIVRERVKALCERFPIYESRLVRSRAQLS